MQLGLRAVERSASASPANCAFGVGLWFALQALVSIGVNLGAAADQRPDAADDQLRRIERA